MVWAAGQIVEADDMPSAAVQIDDPTNAASALAATTTPQHGTTICGVSFVAPPSGKVMVYGNFLFSISGTGVQVYMAPQVREGSVVGSGTVVFNPSGDQSCKVGGATTGVTSGGCQTMVDDLTPGASYNVAATFFAPSGTSPACQYFARQVGAFPLWA